MAGGMRKLGIGALGFAAALVVGEARNPGTASQTVESTVNGAVPVVRGGGVLAGETLSAGTPVFEGAREAIGGLGMAATAVAPTEDTLPTTPLAGE
jgi:hypothetical protein